MVTDENFGELLIEGLEQIAAYRRGELPADKIAKRFTPPWRVQTSDDGDVDGDSEDPPREFDPRNRLRP